MSADLYEPFRVDWELATPMVIPDFAIHLDALLSRARVERDAALDLPVPWANQYDLPLARFETASDWCFKASTLVLTPLGQPMQYHQVRRANVDTWRYGFERGLFARTPPFDPGRTYTKAVSMQVPMQMMTHAHAYGVGNIEAV
ncbi:MAG: hypothetical protein JNM52_09980, partial [Betaproteobacteria bacterium]|nr:hypothetical protein [Betaproteobacteria bacterium]